MADKRKVVLGICKTRPEVIQVVETLKMEGFVADDISVLMPDISGSQEFAHTKGTKAPEGAATGAGTGAVIGGTLGLLAGVGALAIPGVGPFIAAGPIMGLLAGAGVGGTIGGISGALIGLGIPEYEAKRYEGFLKEGGILISVHTANDEQIELAKRCLEQCGAKDISTTGEVRSSGAPTTSAYRDRDVSSPSVSSTSVSSSVNPRGTSPTGNTPTVNT